MKEKHSNEWKWSKKLQQMHLEKLLPTRTAGLQAALFLFFKPLVNHSKISFPFSNVSSLLLSLLLLLSLSRCRAIRDAKNLPSPLFQSSPQQSIPTQNFQNLPHTFSKMPFIPAYPPSASAPPHVSSPSTLESPTTSLGTLDYSTPPSITRWAATPHKSTIAYPSRIHMDSGWVAINPQTSQVDS